MHVDDVEQVAQNAGVRREAHSDSGGRGLTRRYRRTEEILSFHHTDYGFPARAWRQVW